MPEEKLRGSPEGLRSIMPDARRIKSYGKRKDDTPKGPGYFGELARTDDPETFSTELSLQFDVDGKKILAPVLVPTLTPEEIAHLVDGGQPTKDIVRKAQKFLYARLDQGKSPFASLGEQVPLPVSSTTQFNEGFNSP